ncbi:hypothetical protein TRICHSKD4_5523 [Roseibium sp. TrichSKD4]|nr:hypothetical protein TRICHSKD4_5523 [Roseibium sp. TrichSKD4]
MQHNPITQIGWWIEVRSIYIFNYELIFEPVNRYETQYTFGF